MKTYNYKKSFLLFTHIILGAILLFFTLLAVTDYTKNLILGYFISFIIVVIYFIVLKKSASLYNIAHVWGAYFLAIGGFVSLMFIQMINCTNSLNFLL